jgi:hypothetical protein
MNSVKKAWNTFQKHISPAAMATILAAVICAMILFVPPVNGYADNGDFYRAMLSNGIYRLPTEHSQYIGFVETKFGILKYFNENNVAVFSSQALFVKAAVLLNKLFYSHRYFDIRFLGIVYYVAFLPGVYLLTKALAGTWRRIRNYVIAIFVVLIFADASFILYFNSFFAEPGMLIAFLYAFASIILLARGCYSKRWKLLLLYFISIVLLITNKQQNAPLALSFGVVSMGLFFLPGLKKQKKLAIIGGVVGIMGAGILTYSLINKEFNDVNQYQSFTHGVLMETGDPSKNIKKSGLSEQFALMREQNYYAKTFDTVDPSSAYIRKHLVGKYNFAWIVKYYAQNPQQFLRLLDVASKDIMVTQVKAVGDYTKSSGKKAGQQSTFFTLYSSLAGAFFPGKYAFLCLLALTFIIVYAVSAYIDFAAGRLFGVMRFFLVLGLMTICVFVPIVSIIGDGDADLAKHLFMVPLSLDLTFIMFISDILNGQLWLTEQEEDEDE